VAAIPTVEGAGGGGGGIPTVSRIASAADDATGVVDVRGEGATRWGWSCDRPHDRRNASCNRTTNIFLQSKRCGIMHLWVHSRKSKNTHSKKEKKLLAIPNSFSSSSFVVPKKITPFRCPFHLGRLHPPPPNKLAAILVSIIEAHLSSTLAGRHTRRTIAGRV
jgi:hypothetical protein